MKFPVFAFFERSLRVETRSLMMCFARVGLLGIIFLVMIPMEIAASSGMMGAPGLQVFESIIWIDFVILSVAGLSYFATAISEEKEEMTLGLLRMTNLNPVSILLGKSTSRLIGATMVLVVQVPVVMLAVTLGGVSLRQILAAYCTLFGYMFFVCNLALFFSVIFRRSVTATFLAGLFLLLFFIWPGIVGSLLNGASFSYQIDLSKGGWAMIMMVVGWGEAAEPTGQISRIFRTGFADSPVSFQMLSNIGLGIAAFLLSWLVFERFTREQKDDAPVRAPLLRRTGRSSRVPAYVSGPNAITWKDSVFLGGGTVGAIIKFVLVGLIIGGCILTVSRASMEAIDRQMAGMTTFVASLVIMAALLPFEVSRLFKSEVQWKTLSSLVTLPITIRELAYRKVLGCLIGLWPVAVYFVIGVMTIPDKLAEGIFNSHAKQELIFLSMGFAQYVLFLHIVALLSLLIKRGALPLAFVVHYIGGMVAMMPLSLGMMAVGSWSGWGMGGVFVTYLIALAVTVGATIGLHYWIGYRLVKVAAEE